MAQVALKHSQSESLTLRQIFDGQFDQVKFDKALCQRIIRYSQKFMTRNDDHSAFFGGVLLGVNPIRFLESDRETWYEDVLDIDEDLLLAEFHKAGAINFEFKVMSDAFNYTPAYVCHRLEQVTNIPQALKRQAQIHAFMVLHYRFLTSLLVTRFRYPADPEIAQAAYAALSGRFDIKRYGSWRALLEARSESIVEPNSIYRRVITEFSPDSSVGEGPSVIRIVTDTQGRIREVVNKIYSVYVATKEGGSRISSTSDLAISSDGELVLKDRKNGYASYLRYINEIVQSEKNLIKQELVDIIANAMTTMPPNLLVDSLKYLSANYRQKGQGYLEEIVQENLLYTFDYLNSNRLLFGKSNDLPALIARLRSLYMASRSSDPVVLKLRNLTEKMVDASVKSRNQAVIAAVRTGVLLYLVLRAMTKQHYS